MFLKKKKVFITGENNIAINYVFQTNVRSETKHYWLFFFIL